MNLRKQFENETGKKAPFHGDYLPYGNSFGFACAEKDYYRFYTEWLEAKVSQWISVSDELPEYSIWVIVYRPAWLGRPVITAQLECINKSGQVWIDEEGYRMTGTPITHWKLLPEPPEQKD